jgi:hypothetical protein
VDNVISYKNNIVFSIKKKKEITKKFKILKIKEKKKNNLYNEERRKPTLQKRGRVQGESLCR